VCGELVGLGGRGRDFCFFLYLSSSFESCFVTLLYDWFPGDEPYDDASCAPFQFVCDGFLEQPLESVMYSSFMVCIELLKFTHCLPILSLCFCWLISGMSILISDCPKLEPFSESCLDDIRHPGGSVLPLGRFRTQMPVLHGLPLLREASFEYMVPAYCVLTCCYFCHG
jgi:hypothetical protein